MKKIILFAICGILWMGCSRPSAVDKYRAEKHVRDSVSLIAQERSLEYYQSQLETLMPEADSLLALFKYERNEKYQDHGYYVTYGQNGLRILVRDDGKDLLLYRNGKRIPSTRDGLQGKDKDMYDRAEHLRIVISDIRELEKRIAHTSLEIQKYQRRLEK